MWYLPVTDRLRRIFLNPKEAALMTWWDNKRKVDDDVIAHSADGSQWQDFDNNNPVWTQGMSLREVCGFLTFYCVIIYAVYVTN